MWHIQLHTFSHKGCDEVNEEAILGRGPEEVSQWAWQFVRQVHIYLVELSPNTNDILTTYNYLNTLSMIFLSIIHSNNLFVAYKHYKTVINHSNTLIENVTVAHLPCAVTTPAGKAQKSNDDAFEIWETIEGVQRTKWSYEDGFNICAKKYTHLKH